MAVREVVCGARRVKIRVVDWPLSRVRSDGSTLDKPIGARAGSSRPPSTFPIALARLLQHKRWLRKPIPRRPRRSHPRRIISPPQPHLKPHLPQLQRRNLEPILPQHPQHFRLPHLLPKQLPHPFVELGCHLGAHPRRESPLADPPRQRSPRAAHLELVPEESKDLVLLLALLDPLGDVGAEPSREGPGAARPAWSVLHCCCERALGGHKGRNVTMLVRFTIASEV